MAEPGGLGIGQAVVLLGAAVIAVPIFRKLGLGSILGYLAAGLVIGPFGLALFSDGETLLHVSELGVVLFLFIIGLEMRPAKLWALRRAIFGLGAAQVIACGALLTAVGALAGLNPAVAAAGAMGFVMSSTAVIVQMLEEEGKLAEPVGQRAVAILLFEDLAIIPLLAMVALWGALNGSGDADARPAWQAILIGAGAIALVVGVGRYLLDPFFRILARSGAREVMVAAALLVVLGTAVFMQWAGLSMAMGAFLAGVLLSESTFRHQLEADIEPFRGILLGLFFLSVGMVLDLSVVVAEWRWVLSGVAVFMIVKALGIYGIGRMLRASHGESVQRAALFAQGGEFAFVLYAAALAVGLFDARISAIMTAIVILSMALTPLVLLVLKSRPTPAPSLDGVDSPEGLSSRVLFIGFGRFAQVVSQPLLARNVDLSVIENDVEMIQAAGNFGFKVYYGDGTRLDVLRASGAGRAEAILICVDKAEVADRIVELCNAEFPQARLFVRAYDRGHVLRLVKAGVEFQIRETFESALVFGQAVLEGLGVDHDDAVNEISDVRRRDEQRRELELVSGLSAGRPLLRNNTTTFQPEPFVKPKRPGQVIDVDDSPEAA